MRTRAPEFEKGSTYMLGQRCITYTNFETDNKTIKKMTKITISIFKDEILIMY